MSILLHVGLLLARRLQIAFCIYRNYPSSRVTAPSLVLVSEGCQSTWAAFISLVMSWIWLFCLEFVYVDVREELQVV